MKKYENFCRAFDNLSGVFRYEEPYDTVVLTGLVGLFEICFEQSWKAVKEILESHGYEEGQTGSPKLVLKTAYRAGMIRDQQKWLAALIARNNVAHAYNEAVALDIVRQTRETFYDMFKELKEEIEGNWIA